MFLLLCVLLDGEGDYQSPLPSGCLPCGSCLGVPSYRIFISFLGITHLWELEHKVETDIKPRRLSSWVSLEGAPRHGPALTPDVPIVAKGMINSWFLEILKPL